MGMVDSTPGMGSAMTDEPQDIAEALDADVLDDSDDYTGDEVVQYPPDHPLVLEEFDDIVDPEDPASTAEEFASEGIDVIPDGGLSGEAVQIAGLEVSAEEAAMHVDDV